MAVKDYAPFSKSLKILEKYVNTVSFCNWNLLNELFTQFEESEPKLCSILVIVFIRVVILARNVDDLPMI